MFWVLFLQQKIYEPLIYIELADKLKPTQKIINAFLYKILDIHSLYLY